MKKVFIIINMILGLMFGPVATVATVVAGSGAVFAEGGTGDLDSGGSDANGAGAGLDSGPETESKIIPEVYIKAVNPGYTVDGVSNVGEMIEIARKDPGAPISLANLAVSYTTSSGKTTVLVEFPEHSWLVGESVLLRLASSPSSELAALNYSKTLAMKGSLSLLNNWEAVDTVCWTGAAGCLTEFKTANPTTLLRDISTGEFRHMPNYLPEYMEESYLVETIEEEGYGGAAAQCVGLKFSEILSYYAETKEEQFIELYNTGSEQILTTGCKIKYKNKFYELSGVVKPEEYLVVYPATLGFSLTKNPTNTNSLELIDADGTTIDVLTYPNGQRKGTAWAWIGYDTAGEELWKTSYAATPGGPNNYQEFKTCEEGKVINEATGNCVKVTTVEEKVCAVGQYLNLLTNRCNKIKEESVKTCKEGYYYYEETGRCRKIVVNDGANYELQAENYEENSAFTAVYVVAGVAAVGIGYVGFEFRHEIKKFLKRVFKKDLGHLSWRDLGHLFKMRLAALDGSSRIRRVLKRVLDKLGRGFGRH